MWESRVTSIGRFKQMARLIEFPFGIIRRVTYVSSERHVHPLNRHERRLIPQLAAKIRREEERIRCRVQRDRDYIRIATFICVKNDIRVVAMSTCFRLSRSRSRPVDPQVKLCANVNFTRTRALTSSLSSFRSTARQHQSSANLDWQVPPTQFRRTTSGSHPGTWTGRAAE